MDVSIIIVNWHSKDYLKDCLKSIYGVKSELSYEVVVIDSASYDGTDQMVHADFPEVKFIQSHENLGFAKANNIAYKSSQGKNILFLNPDTEVINDAIDKLFKQLVGSEKTGAVGAKILNSDGTVQKTAIRAFPNILNQVFDSNLLKEMLPSSKLWGMAPLYRHERFPIEVDAISGACIMVRRKVFEDVHYFSEDYFMYSEDIDLCRKIWNKGWKIKYIPDARITHHGSASSSQNSQNNFKNVMMLESRYKFFCKFQSNMYGRVFKSTIFLTSLFRILILLIMLPVARNTGRRKRHEMAISKWLARLSWTIGINHFRHQFKTPAKIASHLD